MRGALVAHPGTQYSFRLASELERRGRLAGFHTGFAVSDGSLLARSLDLLSKRATRSLANRRLDGVPNDKVHLYPSGEIASLIRQRSGRINPELVLHRRNDRFQRAIPQGAISAAGAVIGFDTSSWILAERCRQAGVPLVLSQTTVHPDSKIEIYKRLSTEYPEWSAGLQTRLPELRQAEQLEHDLAAVVVAASSFTVRTLTAHGVAADKIRLNPYGVDAVHFKAKQNSGNHALRFIFVGSLTACKGVPLLLEAWQRLGPRSAELWLVGPEVNFVRERLPQLAGLRVLGSVPHFEMPSIMQQCDVLIFPSYFEGFGLVILEAMACGLPVIATDATAASDIYHSHDGGWIFPVGDVEALAATLDSCLCDARGTREMGRIARRIAERFTWAACGERWIDIIDELSTIKS